MSKDGRKEKQGGERRGQLWGEKRWRREMQEEEERRSNSFILTHSLTVFFCLFIHCHLFIHHSSIRSLVLS